MDVDMSGGAYAYAFETVECFADALEAGMTFGDVHDARPTDHANDHARLGFAVHLRNVAAAMKAIEWVDSGDCSPPHDTEAIGMVTGI
jgi:hypothetical protein